MFTLAPVKAALVALLAAAATLSAHAQTPAKTGSDDTVQQITAELEQEMMVVVAGMLDTCKASFPARAKEFDAVWTEGMKAAPPTAIAYMQTADFTAKRKKYHEEQHAESAKPGQAKKLEKTCDRLLR